MKKFLVRFFLSLSVLLPGAHGVLHGHVQDDSIHQSVDFFAKLAAGNSSAENEFPSLIFKSASSDAGKKTFQIDITEAREKEEDEHESYSLKRNYKNTVWFFTIFQSKTANGLHHGNSSLSSRKHFDPSSSYRYLTLRVFRI